MKLNYDLYTGEEVYAKLTHTFKSIEFTIFVNEEISTDNECQKCHAVFRTPKGKYRHDFLVSKEFIEDVSELDFLIHVTDLAYDSFEKTHGWT